MYEGKTIIEHLHEREITRVASRSPSDLIKFQDTPVIVGSKVLRDTLNAYLLVAHAAHVNETIQIFHAVDMIRGKTLTHTLANRLRALPTQATSEMIGSLPLFVGMRVMITENLSVPFKIVNGSEGIVHSFSYEQNEQGCKVANVVYVQVPGCDIDAPGLGVGIVPVFPSSVSIPYHVKIGE